VLADLCGQPLLAWLVERLRPSRFAADLVVATTTDPDDDEVAELCEDLGARVFRGHPTDVLARYSAAAEELRPDAVVRISGDSPFIDATTLDLVVDDFLGGGADLVENHRRPGWPAGTAVEAMTVDALQRMADGAHEQRHREHVTMYGYETPGFVTRHVPPPPDARAPDLRIYVDTAEDLEHARAICESFAPRRDFGISEIVERFA
jgi:spore coat polysaccharide biosynthesis protein SpsF